MPGPLTTVQRVRELGGLNEDDAHETFRLADSGALDDRIEVEIAVASAWLQSRGGADYDSGDAVKDVLFAEAEAYLALQQLYETLKMRKVAGTHWPLESEDSDRYEDLIDVEIPAHIQKFLEPYLVVTAPDKPFAAPVMVVSGPVNRQQVKPVTEQYADLIDEANGVDRRFSE